MLVRWDKDCSECGVTMIRIAYGHQCEVDGCGMSISYFPGAVCLDCGNRLPCDDHASE